METFSEQCYNPVYDAKLEARICQIIKQVKVYL